MPSFRTKVSHDDMCRENAITLIVNTVTNITDD